MKLLAIIFLAAVSLNVFSQGELKKLTLKNCANSDLAKKYCGAMGERPDIFSCDGKYVDGQGQEYTQNSSGQLLLNGEVIGEIDN